ncbi:hypothetical protein GGI23_003582, partial [Coemansia sp. RSA 2559]
SLQPYLRPLHSLSLPLRHLLLALTELSAASSMLLRLSQVESVKRLTSFLGLAP